MKWVFLAGLIVFSAALAAMLKQNRKWFPAAAFLLGLLPFIEARFHLLAAPISWAAWLGQSKGIEVSLMDGVACALLLASRRAGSPTGLKIALGVVSLAYFVSTVANGAQMEILFCGWDIFRSVIVFLAVFRASATDQRVPIWLLNGLIAGLVSQAFVVVSQYAGGDPQAAGWLGHQNMLGFATHYCVYPAFAAFLGGYYRKRAIVAVFAALVIAFTGASRATIGLMVVGMFMTMVFSAWHRSSGRKTAFIAATLIGLLAVTPLLYSALGRRSVDQREKSTEARGTMESAARMIISDFPLGIGANRYVVVANLGGYSERAGVSWDRGSRGAPVHNSYYLVTAEMGWLGLAGMISLLAAGLLVAICALRRSAAGFEGELSAGIAATILVVSIHAYVEWIFMMHINQELLSISLGIVSAVYAKSRRGAVATPSTSLTPHRPVLGTAMAMRHATDLPG